MTKKTNTVKTISISSKPAAFEKTASNSYVVTPTPAAPAQQCSCNHSEKLSCHLHKTARLFSIAGILLLFGLLCYFVASYDGVENSGIFGTEHPNIVANVDAVFGATGIAALLLGLSVLIIACIKFIAVLAIHHHNKLHKPL
jgi:hypothetical protein